MIDGNNKDEYHAFSICFLSGSDRIRVDIPPTHHLSEIPDHFHPDVVSEDERNLAGMDGTGQCAGHEPSEPHHRNELCH